MKENNILEFEMLQDHLLNILDQNMIQVLIFKQKKSNAENLHCKPLSFHLSFSHDKDFHPFFFLPGRTLNP